MKKLKARDGARCGMVVPEGTLFRSGAFASVKKTLLEDFDLFMVVSLPPGTFAPYSDVKAGLLFFQRPGPTKEVLYYELPLTEGLKKFSKGSPIADEHFDGARQVWERWKAYRQEKAPQPELTDTSWIEAAETLASSGFDLSPKNPSRLYAEPLPHPAVLTAMLLEHSQEFHGVLDRLHDMVSSGERA